MTLRIFKMSFANLYPAYVAKAARKGRSKAELDELIFWLTGYDAGGLARAIDDGRDVAAFFAQAPAMNPDRILITGVICGIRIEEIADPMMRDIRVLDKLVDALAKGRALEKILQVR